MTSEHFNKCCGYICCILSAQCNAWQWTSLFVCRCVFATLRNRGMRCSISLLGHSVFIGSLPNLECLSPDKFSRSRHRGLLHCDVGKCLNVTAHARRLTSSLLKFCLSSTPATTFSHLISPNLKQWHVMKFARQSSFVRENGRHHCSYAAIKFPVFDVLHSNRCQKRHFSCDFRQIVCIGLKFDYVQFFNFFSKAEVDFPSCASLTSDSMHIQYQRSLNVAYYIA